MSKTHYLNFGNSQGFDCSAYLDHGMNLCVNECPHAIDTRSYGDCSKNSRRFSTKTGDIPYPVGDCKSTAIGGINKGSKRKASSLIFLEDNYYKSEYNNLLQWINEEEVIVPPDSQFADKREEIDNVSLLAEEVWSNDVLQQRKENRSCSLLCRDLANEVAIKAIETPRHDSRVGSSCENLATDVAIKAIETPRPTISTEGFQNFVEEQLKGFGSSPENPQVYTAQLHGMSPGSFQNLIDKQLEGFGDSTKKSQDGVFRKRRLCRHFVKGFCHRGSSCDFLHDPSIFCSDDQKVFLGGLPLHFTSGLLKSKLEEKGLIVLNNPRIIRGYTPEVCLGSAEEAEKLIAGQHIYFGQHRVDVRVFRDKEQLRHVVPCAAKRSVFLGGLPEGTTGDMIISDLQRMDVKVVDLPVIKDGYAPRVVLGTLEHAKMLVSLKRVMVNGTVVDVRPYVNFRKRY